MCRSMKRVQYVNKTTSSAEDDNWDYDKIQRTENTKQKKGFYNATLTGQQCQQRTNQIHY